ncbi:MAG: hypothetical protein ACXVZL_06605, partial [Gaiellaceae bacterium]
MTPRRSMLALVLAASGVLGVAVSASGTSGGWGPPQRVATADDAADVHAGIDADGNAVVVWEAGGVWAAVRPQGLGRWQRSVRVSGKGVGIEAVDAAVNAAGDVVVAYLVVAGSGHRAEVVTGSTHGGWHRPRPLGSARCCAIGAGVDGRGFASVLFLGPE